MQKRYQLHADQFNLSANYFGDLVKKETGKTPLEYIQLKILDLAKEKIFKRGKSVNEIAYEFGFSQNRFNNL
ncbi:helix-turn-helix domain-containing protein [Flavobacterium chungbukense]|uniref:helix-turn-helix domain-containing protein n=1 Tax=Flavobacterium chungbukense TaxID=877464 RepID=UPI00293E456F|nr:helix-turn-helix domain-containing protein [Flavobacterium chungbukense]